MCPHQDSDFPGGLEISESTSEGMLFIFGSHSFVPIGWTSKRQTAASNSTTETEIISLDTGPRLEGILSLGLWDLLIEVLHFGARRKPLHDIRDMEEIDFDPPNGEQFRHTAVLFNFEENEAVIKAQGSGLKAQDSSTFGLFACQKQSALHPHTPLSHN